MFERQISNILREHLSFSYLGSEYKRKRFNRKHEKEMIVKVKLMFNTCKYFYLMDLWNIYFQDAFSGCQILPCSHKVHRECAIAMIQNGV